MSYTAEWTSILSSDCDIVISPTEELSLQTDLITFLATAQRFQIPILPTTWETGRSEAGLGGTSIIHGSDVDLVTLFAYKRVHETSKRTTTENQLFGLLVREITISGHNFIRQNPHITQLQGICWDISADDKPWPVLIFERSDLRDLYSYYDRKPSWQETDLPARIRYCVEIGTAIIAMHSICTVHGDIKPENVLLFMQKDKPNITKVIDFGYSLQFTPRSRKMKLPISRPWNAPEHTRGMREWTFEQAVKTEVFSYGMLCLWMLFYDYFYKLCPGKGSRYGISTVKESLRPLSRLLLADEPSLTSDQRQSLGNFFDASLQEDPQQRESSIVRLLQNLDPQWSTSGKTSVIDNGESPKASDFKLESSIQDLYCSDYRVRSHIAREILASCRNQPALALQMALCYTIGFGVAKDQAKATDMLALHNIDVSSLDSLVIRCLQQTSISPSISLHKLWRMGHINCIDLSHIYLRQGKLKSAEEHLLREIRDLEATSGKDTTIATALGTELSRLYQVQGRFKEAQDIQEQLVSRHKALFGESHPDTLVSMADLASILCSRGLWKDAEQLQERLLEVTKNNSGGGDFEAICTAFGLASTYLRQGKWLKGGETINAAGDLSRGTFSAGNSLLLQYHALGIISVLEEYQLRGLFYFFHVFIDIVFRKVLGEEHPNVLMLTSLAGLCLAKHERWEEAESWLSHILNAREHLLGKGHPDTLQSMTHLAITLKQRGRLEDAEELQTLAVGRQSKLLGRDHPDTIAGFTSLASIYLDQLRWKEAEDLEVENSKLKEIKLGHCHRETLVSMINLVCIYLNQGRTHEATVQKGQVMERCKASWEKVPYDAWIDIANISLVMSQRGWWEESEGLQRQLLDMSIKEFGECESLTFTSKNLLASTLWRQGRWEEAEEMQKQTVDYGREQSWDEFPVFLDCLDNYNEMKEGLHKGVLKQ